MGMRGNVVKLIALVIVFMFSSNLIPFASDVNVAKDDIILEIENPNQNHELTGDFFIKGYSVSKNGVEKVTASIDGGKEILLDYGIEREDVEKKYPDYKDSLKSGYSKTISGLKNGKHKLVIKTTTKDKKIIEKELYIQVDTKVTPNMGIGKATKSQMKALLYENHKGIYSQKQLDEFVDYTIKESNIEGINYDIAFSLMMVETGYLNFGNDVKPGQNNFGGLGATGNGNTGESYSSMQIGIRAVIQHLKAYSSDKPLNQSCVDNRFQYVKRNSAKYVRHLGIKENPIGAGWAAGKDYGKKIKNIRDKIYTFKVDQESILENFNVTGDIKIGQTINISAKASPVNESLYKIMIKENGSWKTISDYSNKSSMSYKITKPGTFAVQVLVKHKDSNKSYDDGKSTSNYTIKSVESKIEKFNVSGKYELGQTINIESKATPYEDTLYKIMIKENGSWKTISDYSNKSSMSYKITKPGTFAVQVLVKHKDSNKSYDDGKSTSNYTIKSVESKIEKFNVSGKYELGQTINIESQATPYEDTLYKIMVKENGSWKTISDYSNKSSMSYKITKPGIFAVQVLVKHKDSNKSYDDGKSTSNYTIKSVESKIEKFNVSGKYELGQTINIDSRAMPHEDTLYKIMVKENGSWKTISDYSNKSSMNYKITKTGTFAVQVLVKHKNSNKNYDDGKSTSNYIIENGKSKIESFSFEGEKKVGSKLTISAKSINHEDTLYKIMIKENGNWKILSDYSSKNKTEYIVKTPGIYAAQVLVKHKTSNNSYDDGKSSTNIQMKTDVSMAETKISGNFKIGENIKIKSLANPSSLAMYKIMVKENGSWRTLSDYSSKNEIEYKFEKPGQYAFQVLVKSKNNNLADYEDYWSSSYINIKENKKKILIDAGHGSGNKNFDNGDKGSQATHGGKTYIESELNIQIANKLKLALEKKDMKF